MEPSPKRMRSAEPEAAPAGEAPSAPECQEQPMAEASVQQQQPAPEQPQEEAAPAPAAPEDEAGPSGRVEEGGVSLRPRREGAGGLLEKKKEEEKRLEEEQRAREIADRDRCLNQQEEAGELVFKVITNDGQRQHMMWLIDLKNIFAKQLPNMPKEYIVRLIFDHRHRSLLALKGSTVIGGITYRVFDKQKVGEIAFCAVSASEQVKGYGTRLMNKTKESVKANEGLTHLITFADNNAVGYFQKQGFTKEIILEREKWSQYIKEYDGGTLMECILSRVDIPPGEFPATIRSQREAVEGKILEMTNLHVVRPGLEHFKGGGKGPLSPEDIPGVRESGWVSNPPRFRILMQPGNTNGVAPTTENLQRFMRTLLGLVTDHQDAWPFVEPVDAAEVPDYYEVIKNPMSLALIQQRLQSQQYYVTLEMFAADFRIMFSNARKYNAQDTEYYKCANRLENFFDSKVAAGLSWGRRP